MALTLPTWTALAPILVMAATAFVLFVIDSVDPESTNDALLTGVAVGGSILAFLVAGWYLFAGTGQPETGGAITLFGGQLIVDGMSLFFALIVTGVTALVSLGSYEYVAGRRYRAEYYSLVVLAATGMLVMASANSLVVAFIALELSSLPSYALVAYLKDNRGSVEASLKYFLIGALSSAILLYGISLVYGATGVLQFDAVREAAAGTPVVGVLGIGVLMILGGLAFKTASVPFHFWAPEAYEGAPAPISAFLSSASKAAGFVLAFRIFLGMFPELAGLGGGAVTVDWILAATVLAVVTMFVGNFAAATQETVKRMLAYSSIGHAGYVLIGLAALSTGEGANNAFVLGASMMHLFVYGFMNAGAFLFVALAEYWEVGRTFEDYNGLARRAPVASVAMTVCLFSLAGLPVGGGFLSKLYLLAATASAGAWLLGASLVINSALSLFYYARVVKALWIEEPDGEFDVGDHPTGLYLALIGAAIVTVLLLPAFGLVSPSSFTGAGALL